jgi:hypothetical protein
MTELRGTFRHGVIVINDHNGSPQLRDGDEVAISRVTKPSRTATTRSGRVARTPRVSTRGQAVTQALDAMFGCQQARKGWKGKSTSQIARALRREATGWDTRR